MGNSYIPPGSTCYTFPEKNTLKKRLKKIYQEQPGEHIFKPETPYERFPVVKSVLVFSLPLLRLLQKIKVRFSPTHITLTGLLCNIMAGVSFATGHLPQGALLFFTALVLDFVDGPWARLTNQCSNFGKKLDPLCDKIGKASCFAGLCYHQPAIIGLIFSYYLLEFYATQVFPNRFSNPRNWSFSVWEVSFLILFIGPILNMVHFFSALSISLLAILYITKTIREK